MNHERIAATCRNIIAAIDRWMPRLSLLWYLIAAVIFATVLAEIAPREPRPDWAIFTLFAGILIVAMLRPSARK